MRRRRSSCATHGAARSQLFRSPIYSLGIAIALGSWGFHVGALALAPISLVQSVIAGGLVLLTVVADRLFGIEVTRREWIGVGLTAAGLAFLAATLDGDGGSAHSHYDPATLAVFLAAVGAVGLLLACAPRRPALAGGLGRPAVGDVGHLDQGAQLPPRRARVSA